MAKKNYRRVSVVVTAQTLGNLEKLAKMSGYGNLGLVVDKLVREKMIQLRMWDTRQELCRRQPLSRPLADSSPCTGEPFRGAAGKDGRRRG